MAKTPIRKLCNIRNRGKASIQKFLQTIWDRDTTKPIKTLNSRELLKLIDIIPMTHTKNEDKKQIIIKNLYVKGVTVHLIEAISSQSTWKNMLIVEYYTF